MYKNICPYKNPLSISFLVKIWCFFNNLVASYDQTVPKLDVFINILMKNYQILTYSWNENMDKMARPRLQRHTIYTCSNFGGLWKLSYA